METTIEGVIGEGKTRRMRESDCEIATMGPEGDIKTIWDKANADEVANAERTYNDLTAKGYRAFRVDKKGEKDGEPMDKFDPNAEAIILVPALQGG